MYRLRQSATVLLILSAVALALAAKEFTPPRAADAKTYPAHDEHAQEHVTIAVDPYDTAAKSAVFKTDWRGQGYLPMQLVVTNDGDTPVALTSIKVELVTANRSKIQPATDEDIYRRLGRVKRRGDEASRNPLPIPLPRKGPDVGISKDVRQEVEAAQFRALAVEPHTSRGGFIFFDVSGIREPLAGSRLYVSGVRDGDGRELMFFEIPMEKYLNSAPAR